MFHTTRQPIQCTGNTCASPEKIPTAFDTDEGKNMKENTFAYLIEYSAADRLGRDKFFHFILFGCGFR